MLKYLGYIIGVAVGAFAVGAGYNAFLNHKIDKRIAATDFEMIGKGDQGVRSSLDRQIDKRIAAANFETITEDGKVMRPSLNDRIDKRIAATNFEVIEKEFHGSVMASWFSLDHLTCPNGFVVKAFGSDAPQGDVAGDRNEFRCVRLAIEVSAPK